MSEEFGVKVEEIFNTMQERFRPEGAEGVEDSFGYDITGRGKWKLTVKFNEMKLEQTDDLEGCVVVTVTDPDTFVGVNTGKVDPMKAFNSGKFTVKGDLGALGKTAKMFRKFVPAKKVMSTRDYIIDMFGTLEARFQPEAAQGQDMIVCYDISGPDGGKWSAHIKDGNCKLVEGRDEKSSIVMEVKDTDYVDLMLGKVDPMSLLSAGKAALVGEMALALKLGEIFAKYQDPAAEDSGKPEQELLVLKKTISVNQKYATGPVMGKMLQALKDKKILANRCHVCGRLQLPAREACAVCRVRVTEFVEVGPKGTITINDISYYASPDPLTGETRETPYGSINVLLDGCKGNETFWHFIRPDQTFKLKEAWNETKGTRVRPVWAKDRKGELSDILYFEIDE